ncbi:hypothetical protein NMY22_g2736 [Coprinellus aureogranulatus]|nr:hypothetical protein NMY22_g2736 [Coprinellus aureogranulatus]
MSGESRPIVIVTGANGGVGYGICQRLLVQLSSSKPSDSHPYDFEEKASAEKDASSQRYNGLTLIMACRSVSRAQKARDELLRWFGAHVRKAKSQPGYDGHAEEFQKNITVEVEYVDLASIKTVLEFGERITKKYPYVSHLMCNAGLASFIAIDWSIAIRQILSSPMQAVTAPLFYSQHVGELSVDGLGWVWQCNVFGHFAMFRSLEKSLSSSPLGPGRVIWCSSIEASPAFYDPSDWQLRSTEHSYESSKYEIDLIATTLNRLSTSPSRVRHMVSQPGVVSTNVAHALVGPVLDMLKVLAFYFARWIGSPHHNIDPFKAAIAAVHLALVPLTCLAFLSQPKTPPVRFGAETDRWGNERVGISPVKAWLANENEGRELVKRCDALFEKLKSEESRGPVSETAREKM